MRNLNDCWDQDQWDLINRVKTDERDVNNIQFIDYCQYVHNGSWVPAAHHCLICDHLQRIIDGELKRLMIFMPPRHGKSMAVTETFPSYFLGKNPDKRVIEVSYSAELAQRFGRLNRRKIEEYGPDIFGIKVSPEHGSKTSWDLYGYTGGMISVGIGGSITGHGADLIVIDDPVKNAQEAESQTYQERVWQEYQYTIRTRLHSGGAMIVILTRWHESDLAGRLLNPEYGPVEDWTILSLPMICESLDDPIGRAPGQALWPEGGYDTDEALRIKASVGSMAWSALYQQRPAPTEGSILQRSWWRFYRRIPERMDRMIQSWDCAFKDSESSDYVVGQVWGQVGADYYLLDQVRDRMDMPGTMSAIRLMSGKWPMAGGKYIEDKANGTAVIQMLRHEITGLIPVEPQGGKVARAQAVSPSIEAGNVHLPSADIAPWVKDLIDECCSFPRGQHDDQVDAMTQALSQLQFGQMRQQPIYDVATYTGKGRSANRTIERASSLKGLFA